MSLYIIDCWSQKFALRLNLRLIIHLWRAGHIVSVRPLQFRLAETSSVTRTFVQSLCMLANQDPSFQPPFLLQWASSDRQIPGLKIECLFEYEIACSFRIPLNTSQPDPSVENFCLLFFDYITSVFIKFYQKDSFCRPLLEECYLACGLPSSLPISPFGRSAYSRILSNRQSHKLRCLKLLPAPASSMPQSDYCSDAPRIARRLSGHDRSCPFHSAVMDHPRAL